MIPRAAATRTENVVLPRVSSLALSDLIDHRVTMFRLLLRAATPPPNSSMMILGTVFLAVGVVGTGPATVQRVLYRLALMIKLNINAIDARHKSALLWR